MPAAHLDRGGTLGADARERRQNSLAGHGAEVDEPFDHVELQGGMYVLLVVIVAGIAERQHTIEPDVVPYRRAYRRQM